MIQSGTANQWQYNYHAFGAANLTNQEHQLEILGGTPNLFIFDYLTYTQVLAITTSTLPNSTIASTTAVRSSAATSQASDTTTSSKSNVRAIAGGVVGGIVAIALIVGGLLLCLRRRRSRNGEDVDLSSETTHSTTGTVGG